jgi:hypothetical protein
MAGELNHITAETTVFESDNKPPDTVDSKPSVSEVRKYGCHGETISNKFYKIIIDPKAGDCINSCFHDKENLG